MPDLKVQRAVTERGATLYTLAATVAKVLIDGVFKKRFFDEFPFEGASGAQLIFSSGIQAQGIGFEISAAQVAIPAELVRMDAFYGGQIPDALGGAASALGAFERIDLPDIFP
jgi:hypothetical protein